jgi:glyoxylase-like metal-dependent hydrolase (beta-lactamase superfamily II)
VVGAHLIAIVWSAAVPGPRLIEHDVRHLGHERVICCFELDGVIVDPGPEVSHATLLESLGDTVPRAILLTHVHLDHAGATGALVKRWPDVEVWVHERGAPHVVDPSKLVASATRLYGDDMARRWGEIVAVPERNLRVLSGGETLEGFRVAYTPGHAQHHVAYLHEASGTAFAGDVAGVRIGAGPVLPPTPPPDIDLEAWRASLQTLAAWAPAQLAITHFGAFDDTSAQLDAVREGLARWGELARDVGEEEYARRIVAHVREHADEGTAAEYVAAMPPGTLWAGLDRYWSRQKG